LAALAAVFLFKPLRGRREENKPADRSEWAAKREVLYESIRDLEHDFETRKIDEADYGVMREELRSDAIELMREEKQAPPSEASAARAIGRACPSCGAAARVAWKFCAECGSHLDPEQGPA
jgi:cytochrome c-type biogenesis protein CcmI